MSDTPLTDEFAEACFSKPVTIEEANFIEFTRRRERELNAMNFRRPYDCFWSRRALEAEKDRDIANQEIATVIQAIVTAENPTGELTDVLNLVEVFIAHHKKVESERDALKVEYESRALWIERMNKILGYDNSDGFHSEPDPHTLAEQLIAQRDHYQRSNQIMSNKYLAASEELRDHQRRLNFLLTPQGQGWVHDRVSHGEPIDITSIDIQSLIP